ncbi:HYR domain-containing protein [Bacillus pakistanensis]|uniref:HYR domain-containing protein n=1 Tax=Rossellomorea pakistanensis TaxID=992288 RepID=UPI0019627D50
MSSDDITVFNDPGRSGAFPEPTVSPGVTAVCTPASGSFFPTGTTTVTCIATDAFGNTSTCTFNVRVLIDPCRFFSSRCRRRKR